MSEPTSKTDSVDEDNCMQPVAPPEQATLGDQLFAGLQYPLPQHLLSRAMHRLSHSERPWLKTPLIGGYRRLIGVDLSEAENSHPEAYRSMNAFFTRSLKSDARPLSDKPQTVISPVDGTVSQAGKICEDRLFQAKGREYSLAELLANDAEASTFEHGQFATLYLSPRDYHRVHMPVPGQLRRMIHIPGRLFSVNPLTVRSVPRLFARNERVVCLFDTEQGPLAVIFVGAIFVGSIETVWHGEVTPPEAVEVQNWDYNDSVLRYERGGEIGRFNMGSTIILLAGKGQLNWSTALQAGAKLRMGEAIGSLKT